MSMSAQVDSATPARSVRRLPLIFARLRLIVALVILAASLLAVFPAPVIPLWLAAIGATEYGHWFFLLPLALVFLGFGRTGLPLLGTILLVCACGFLLSPAVRAGITAPEVKRQVDAAFPLQPSEQAVSSSARAVFSPAALWLPAKAAAETIATLKYSEHEGAPLNLRFYHAAKPHAPCVVVVHTGGWYNGTPDEFIDFNQHLADTGYAVAAIEYRFAPTSPWPAQRDDVLNAIGYLRTQADQLGLDPLKFVLLGRSAGGQIAEAVAYGAHDPTIRGVIAFYAPADMNFAFRYAKSDDILNSLKLLTDFLGGTPWEHPGNYASASGIDLVSPDSPPTLLLHGYRDELVWVLQSQRLADRLKKANVPSTLVQLNWATHAFDYNLNGPGGQIAIWAVDHFLAYATQKAD